MTTWDEFSTTLESSETVCPEEFANIREAVKYLLTLLGEDYVKEAQMITRHPFLGLMTLSWPSLRSEFLEWVAHVRSVAHCPNLEKILRDLRIPNKCGHAYAMVEIAGRMKRWGFNISFEPQGCEREAGLRSDACVELRRTNETFFLELSCQGLADRQLSAFDAMNACQS